MKNKISITGLVLTALALFTVAAIAQEVTNAVPVIPGMPVEPPAWLLSLITQHPWLITVLVAVGALRLAIKPVFSLLHTYTSSTESTKDDEFLAKVEASRWLRWALYALDWVGSIKIIKPTDPKK